MRQLLKCSAGRIFLVALLAMTVALAAHAQTSTTGGISGVVKDPSGAVVPGAKVTATGPNARPQTVTADGNGAYRILNLPPGTYTITVDAGSNFGKYEQQNVVVNLGRVNAAEVTLQLASSTTQVEVNAQAATIDLATTTSGSNVSADQFLNFPTTRSVQGLYNIAPAVTRSGLRDASGRDRDPSVAGSSGPENNYILDGVSTSDPAFGGGGANLPFEFVQEVEIKTGAYGAEYGKSTGGIFNVITKSGTNDFHGDVFGYFTGAGMVRSVKNFPFTGSAANGFSEQDIGGDISGPIKKDKLFFFGAFNPQRRKNFYLTQTFHTPVENKVTIPFYAGKITAALSDKHTLTVSTFGDFTTVDGFLATGALQNVSGFGSDPAAFSGKTQTGGHNYTVRLNSAFTPRFIGEFALGLHYQRANSIPLAASAATPLISDNFAVLLPNNTIAPVVQTGIPTSTNTGFVDYIDGRGGSLQRGWTQGPGFGLFTKSDRNRYESSAHLQNVFSRHSVKYGFEWSRNIYNNINTSTGGPITYANPLAVPPSDPAANVADILATINQRVSNSFSVCTTRGSQIVCPSATATARLSSGLAALPAGLTSVVTGPITTQEAFGNPFLVRTTTRVRDFELHANTYTDVYSGYLQDDFKVMKNLQLNLGLRLDMQSGYDTDGKPYVKLNQFWHDLQPRLGAIWDFTGNGRGKFSVSYARFLETPIPLDVNVRAGGGSSQTDKNFNVNTYGAPAGSTVATGFGPRNLGADQTPIDNAIRPQTMEEYTVGLEYSPLNNFVLGVRGIYRNYINIIEDGSFDDGDHYFLFNPGRRALSDSQLPALLTSIGAGTVAQDFPRATTEDLACAQATIGCFGPARRYYRGIEFTATKRFSNNFQFISSYTYSSLIGNYEGLFRNDNGQSDPNITSLFDLVSLLPGTRGRLPNDRPHQFKFNGSYQTPWKLMVSGNFYVQSGSPFNMLTPHVVYGNNEGFGFCDDPSSTANPNPGVCTPRGTAVVAPVTASQAGFPNIVDSIGERRTPLTHNLDLGFYYPIKFGEKKEIRLSADWFNVTNTQRAVTLDQTFSLNSGVTGVPPVNNPFWGAALLIQPPSQWRFGVKFSF
jgi:outer membrane receptor protein involved in Fe transport